MLLSIVIVNWNVRDQLARLLKSIWRFTTISDFEVIVIDNDSKDGSVQLIRDSFQTEIAAKKLILIDNQYNAGFAKANNQGLKIAQGEYVLFMNPDMEMLEDSFPKLIEFMEKRSDVGICTCRLLYNDKTVQPNVKNDPTFWSQFFILLKLHHFFYWLPTLRKYFAKSFEYDEEREIKQAMGAFIFTRKELMEKLGGWDESYWLWWEDLELCRQVRNAGYKIVFSPHAEVLHYEAQSFNQTHGVKKQKRFNRGLLTYFKKHGTKSEYIALYCLQPISLFLTILTQLFKFKPRTQSRV